LQDGRTPQSTFDRKPEISGWRTTRPRCRFADGQGLVRGVLSFEQEAEEWPLRRGRFLLRIDQRRAGPPEASPVPSRHLHSSRCPPKRRQWQCFAGEHLGRFVGSRGDDPLLLGPPRDHRAPMILRLGLEAPRLRLAGAGIDILGPVPVSVQKLLEPLGRSRRPSGRLLGEGRLVEQLGGLAAVRLAPLLVGQEALRLRCLADREIETVAKPDADGAVARARIGLLAEGVAPRRKRRGFFRTSAAACFSLVHSASARALTPLISAASSRAWPFK
jgi:hypothetical protein